MRGSEAGILMKICPKCKGILEHDMSARSVVLGNTSSHYICRKCGYAGMFFLVKE
jgi:RNase P subunit RPR2